jgi:hypothetical protein
MELNSLIGQLGTKIEFPFTVWFRRTPPRGAGQIADKPSFGVFPPFFCHFLAKKCQEWSSLLHRWPDFGGNE